MSTRVPLGGKRGAGQFAIVDDEDAERVLANSWCVARNGYVLRGETSAERPSGARRSRTIWLSRFVLGMARDDPRDVDHRNGDRLDNRRANLRPATRSQNIANAGPRYGRRYKGVFLDRQSGRWKARITVRYRPINLGSFGDERDAARAYNDAALIHFGEFARLNEIED